LVLAFAVGFASFHARALVNRGRAHQGLGRFEEALTDFSAAREIYDRIGSPSVAYPLVREGSLHLLRGDPLLAHKKEEFVPMEQVRQVEQQLRTWLGPGRSG
jgi:hypothetical protein